MPSFSLKTYQTQALDALTLFLRQAETMGLEPAWAHAMAREGIAGVPYRAGELGDAPVVCLRIPTGGGKTLLASHAIVRIAATWAHRTHPVALWLVPSDAIRSQTLAALQTPGHAYAAALREAYGEAFVVCELDALAAVPPQDYGSMAVIVVATIQSFRVANKAGRRVFAMSEAWEPHFRALELTPQRAAQRGLACVDEADLADPNQTFLTRADLGRVKTSLANWLAWQQPVVVVDEAHNAKTPLSLAMLGGIRPSCVLDLTATPVPKKTNVLFSVSARQLEAEDMIKLPIMLAEHTTGWQDAVRDALLRRAQLDTEAALEPQYVRPIVLFQAEDKGGEATVEALREHLIAVHGIDAREICRATGAWRELEGIDLMQPGPVRYIITVDALREGWDCPFAYVLCALQNLRSNQAVEQLLGRVLRMPYAQRRRSPALNKAYAHVVARSFSEAANALVDTLTQSMGFDRLSAASVLLPDEGDLFGPGPDFDVAPRPLVLELDAPGADATALAQALAAQPDAQVIAIAGEPVRVRLGGGVSEVIEISDQLRAAVLAVLPAAARERAAEQFDEHAARAQAMRSQAERGVVFAPVPRLCVRWQGQLELIERETLAELIAFDLLAADPRPTLPGFNLVEQSEQFEIYLDGERVRARQGDAAQLSLDGVPGSATESDLVRAIEPGVRREGLTQTEALAYVQRVVAHLLHERGFTLTGLLRSRFHLARMIGERIDSLVTQARSEGFQRLMFGGIADAQLAHDPLQAFRFEHGRYPVREAYAGAWVFRKHFYRDIAKLKPNGEEFECAKALDAAPQVLRWVRNLEQQPAFAFWLPTATDYFYPDFVAELHDGRVLVVEYKGEGFATNDDSREKRLVGERWAQQTGQRFAMVEKRLNGLDMATQIAQAAR